MSEHMTKTAVRPAQTMIAPKRVIGSEFRNAGPNSHAQVGLAQLQAVAHASSPVQRLQAIQRAADERFPPVQRVEEEELLQGKALQRVEDDEELLQGKAIQREGFEEEELQMVQRKEIAPAAKGGLPGPLKAGIEGLSGMAMDDVRVHRNSQAPASVQAHAYAQGRDIHLGPGQEKHLAHEAWHVVQQAQGRVQPTQNVGGVAVNDDQNLEAEADQMGAKAASLGDTEAAVQRKREALRVGKSS